jgi:hypothetical protein
MVSLLRESGMGEAWAIAVPASIGVIQVVGRLGLIYWKSASMSIRLIDGSPF